MLIHISFDVDAVLFYGLIFVLILLILYICFEVNYFITCILVIIWCKIRRKRVHVDETTEYYGLCTPNDLDGYFQHMNNSRYVRELDFARLHFYKRTGILGLLHSQNVKVLQASLFIRYKATLDLFTPYKITTRIAYWNERSFYFEQRFIRLSDGVITTVIYSKQTTVGSFNVTTMMNRLLEKRGKICSPELPTEFEDFINLDKKSTETFRKKNGTLQNL